ncbi:MAG: formylglycine-generating enzyme family protein [Chitinispirillia bacterium]|nr:formylglycine-generating enzyme family protein [Chitinispirillia bacterium]MCL2241723.1 formylglycine-generating enzyme family protein [Chitinispirillia bacterium]
MSGRYRKDARIGRAAVIIRCVMYCILHCAVFTPAYAGQGKKENVAFYFAGDAPIQGLYAALGGFLTMEIVNGGKYAAVDRTAQVLDMIAKEQVYQRSGAVDDEQISALGKQWGVKYVIAVEASKSLDGYFLSAKMVDVEGAYIAAMGVATSKLENNNDLKVAINRIVSTLGISDGPAPAPPASSSSAPVSVIGGFEMVFVEGGTFKRGCDKDIDSDCKARHEMTGGSVTVGDFYIGKYEVTQKLWMDVMGGNPSYNKGSGSLPVDMVSWNDALEFIAKISAATGRRFRLPTEAEWEYAARGGQKSRGFKYAGSDNPEDVAWFGAKVPEERTTHPVGRKNPNELGLYDMSGNVGEWVYDRYAESYYRAAPPVNPQGPSANTLNERVHRGGYWGEPARGCRVTGRKYSSAGWKGSTTGFRLAMQP